MPLRVSDGDAFDVAEMTDQRPWRGASPLDDPSMVPADHSRGHASYSSQDSGDRGGPLYEDNLDEAPLDPRHPCGAKPPLHRRGWGEHIPEEDEETTLSTTEASSVSPSLSQQQHSASSRLSLSHRSQRSQRHPRPRQPYDPIREAHPYHEDDVSVLSCQSRTQDRRHSDTSHSSQSAALRQLEARVAQLSLELATAKAVADELRLEGRRVAAERDTGRTNLRLLQQENEFLHATVDRMERERLVRKMEGTTGRSDAATGQRLRDDRTDNVGARHGGALEVPFARERRHHLHPKRQSMASVDLDGTTDEDGLSDGLRLHSAYTVEDAGPGHSRLPWDGVLGRMDSSVAELRASVGSLTRLPSSRESAASPANNDVSRQAPEEGADNPHADHDPFATWSAPGDPKREEEEQGPPRRRWGWGGGNSGDSASRPRRPSAPQPCATVREEPRTALDDNEEDYASFGCASDGSEDSQPLQLNAFQRLLGKGRKT